MKRRNLSGVFYFDKFEGEDKIKPTCFEDCTPEKKMEILDKMNIEQLKNLALILADTLSVVGDHFNISAE